MSEKAPIVTTRVSSAPRETALYGESVLQSRFLMMILPAVLALFIIITFSLSLSQSISEKYNAGQMIFLGISQVFTAAIPCSLLWLVMKEDLGREKLWVIYVIIFFIILECIFTDILLYN